MGLSFLLINVIYIHHHIKTFTPTAISTIAKAI